jgi:hypothetical protein
VRAVGETDGAGLLAGGSHHPPERAKLSTILLLLCVACVL